MTHVCLEAAEKLSAEGIDAEVVDVLTLSPLDEDTILESVARTRRLVVVDEDTPTASMARDIAARVADKGFDNLDAPIKTVNAPDTPVPFACGAGSALCAARGAGDFRGARVVRNGSVTRAATDRHAEHGNVYGRRSVDGVVAHGWNASRGRRTRGGNHDGESDV